MRRSRPSCWRCPPRSTSALLALGLALVLCDALGGAAAAGEDDPADESGPNRVLSGSIDDDEPETAAAKRERELESKKAAALAARFDAALRRITTGKERTAAEELLQLVREAPKSELAPEALFEAGMLYEEHLADPEAARRAYRELVEHYSQSRLLRRAQQRLLQLDTALRTGAAPLVAFQNILRSTAEGSRERQVQLAALVEKTPDFALADHALFLLADTALRMTDRPAARQRFEELYRRFPQSVWAAQGHRLHADTLLNEKHIDEARLHYRALGSYSGALFPLLAKEGLLACDRAARLQALTVGLWLFLGLLGGVWLWRGVRHLWPPPDEFLYYLPVAGLLTLAAFLVRGGMVAAPIWQFSLLGATLTWLAAAAAKRTAATPQPSGLAYGLLLALMLRMAAACAVCYLIIYHHGLLEVIAETLRNGPDTDG